MSKTYSPPDRTAAALTDWPAWPVYGLVDDLLPTLEHWVSQERRIAIATLVHITGSSPRPLGSEMIVADTGEVAGYVSGGCVEGAVAARALEVIRSGVPVYLDYGAGSPVLDVQLTCGGRIGIHVRRLDDAPSFAQRWRAARERREAMDVVIALDDANTAAPTSKSTAFPDRLFTQTYLPPNRLVVAGSDPVTLALCRLAPVMGFEVGLLRPYGPSAPPPGCPLLFYDTRPLARALVDHALDAWTAIYTLTHDIDDDHAVLVHALKSEAFGIGALGSRTKAADRESRLRDAGFTAADVARLDTPAGIDIGALSPNEIALSILAGTIAAQPRAHIQAECASA